MRARIWIFPREGVLDPQGKAVASALHHLGFDRVTQVRMGRAVEVELEGLSREEAEASLRAMCEKLLANPVIESYRYEWVD